MIRENLQVPAKKIVAPVYGKGKGKVVLFAASPGCVEVSDSDDEFVSMAEPIQFPSDECFQADMLDFTNFEKS